ncbi:ArsR/SmtB family transcription factor [Halobacterium litoreum]|uniref:ArsR/SmtB family transcription factor n=1 Tax=Halobacterium litoreum TaxID=2039234 RepID=A0ABD5NJ21_9EURY|nr:winged helix-turn-helix domain-containing protein [Halobacterium litoreum]UHH12153.1 winged helix-turn-helix domain-containing protein [Halobacterium litoreum]
MSTLLPLKPSVDDRDLDPELVAFDDAAADDVFRVASSETARSILVSLYDDPQTASDVADAVDSSVQNVSYHLERLRDAGLIEVVETWYSEQGREMDVYAPANGSLVLFAGAERARPSVSRALRRALSGVVFVALASLVVHFRALSQSSPSPTPIAAPRDAPVQPTDPSLLDAVAAYATGPGGAVFATGLFVIAGAFAFWQYRYAPPSR